MTYSSRSAMNVREQTAPLVVEEEQRLLEVVQRAIQRASVKVEKKGYEQQLMALRDALSEEKLADDQAALIEQMDRIASGTGAAHCGDTQSCEPLLWPYAHRLR